MKICPKCNKSYDDTWKVCLTCSIPIVDAVDQELLDMKSEVSEVRRTMSDISVRLNRIEYFLENRGNEKPKLAPARPENISIKSPAPQPPSEPVVPKKESFVASSETGTRFRYIWSLPNQKNITGELTCPGMEELNAHIKSLGGELVQILWKTEVSLKSEPKKDRSMPTVAPAEKPPVRQVVKAPEPKRSLTENFEQALGEKWFNKLGIFAVVIGVALLIGYSFQYLGAIGKISIGFAFGVGMLLFGHYIEKKKDFSVYGKGLIGGGWAIAYFTTFAMHHIPIVRLIASPFLAMVLLILVSLATVLDIYRYKSQTATGFSYLLIFITLMISPATTFTMLATIPVALSLIFFMKKMKWMEFGLYGMFMTYVTYMGWFGITGLSGRTALTHEQFVSSVMFLVLYWAIFAFAAFFSDKGSKSKLFESFGLNIEMEHIIHGLNTAIASYIGWAIIGAGHSQHLFTALKIACGVYLGLTTFGYFFGKKLVLASSSFAIIYAAVFLSLKYTGYSLVTSELMLASIVLLAGVLLKENYWRTISLAGLAIMAVTLWTSYRLPSSNLDHGQFVQSVVFLATFWIFSLCAAFFSDRESKSKVFASLGLNVRMDHLIYILIASIASDAGWLIINAGHKQHLFLALKLACAGYVALTAIGYFFKKKLILLSSSFAIIYAVMYVSMKYSGYSLTVSYLVLAEVVLLAGVLLKESYWRVASFAGLMVIIAKLMTIDSFYTSNTVMAYHLSTRTLLFGLTFAMYFMNTFLYGKLRSNNLLTKIEENHPNIISYSYPLIYAMGTWLDLPKVLTAPCWVILGAILLHIGVTRNNYHQRIQGYILTTGAFVRLLMSNMILQGGIDMFSYRILTAVPVIAILYYCLLLLHDGKTKSVLNDSEKKMIYLYPHMVFVAIMTLVWHEVPKNMVAPIWGVMAMIYSLRGVYTKEKHYLSISSMAALAACMRAVFVNLYQGKYLVGAESNVILPILTMGLLYGGNIFYLRSKEASKETGGTGEGRIKAFLHSSRVVFGFSATVLLTSILYMKFDGALLTVGLGIEGLLLFLAGIFIKEKQWRIYGLLVLLCTLAKAFLIDLRQLSTIYYILSLIALGLALLFVSYIYTKHKDKIKKLI